MSERSRLRLAILRVLVLTLLGTLLARLWYLQVMAGDEYAAIAKSNRIREVIEAAPRGRLLDDMGRAMVRNRTALVVTVDGSVWDRLPDDGKAVSQRLAKVLGMPLPELAARVETCGPKAKDRVLCWKGSPYQPVPVKSDVTPRVAFRIQEHGEDYPGVEASLQAVREYPHGPVAAHVLGYISAVSEDELKRKEFKDYRRTDLVGRSGLEQVYDRDLRGRSGVRKVAVNSSGRVTGVVDTVSPAPGNDVVLSLDLKLQQVVETALKRGIDNARATIDTREKTGHFKAPAGAAVVLEAKTGQVLAIASYPTYDPSVFLRPIPQSRFDRLFGEAVGSPLTSRATQGLYAPASTFKLISTSSAVMNGQANFNGAYACPGEFKVGTRAFRNFDSAPLGTISMRTALVKSCDTVFYKFAYDNWVIDQRRIDAKQPAAEVLQRMARAYGFGRETGIDLPSEQDGRIVDRGFKQRRFDQNKDIYCKRAQTGYPEEPNAARRKLLEDIAKENCTDGWRYNAGDHVNLSIGQGETVVTPLQLAVAYMALANGGKVLEPHLAKAVVGADGKVMRHIKPVVKGTLPVRADVLASIRSSLAGVTTEGTARGAYAGFPLDRVHVAGKTGTGQVFGKQDTAWFASFAPANDPKYVVVAMVEEAGQGGRIAAPITREIYEGLYGFRGKTAALPHGEVPKSLPRISPDGTVTAPVSPTPKSTATPRAMAALPAYRRWWLS